MGSDIHVIPAAAWPAFRDAARRDGHACRLVATPGSLWKVLSASDVDAADAHATALYVGMPAYDADGSLVAVMCRMSGRDVDERVRIALATTTPRRRVTLVDRDAGFAS